MSRNPDLDPEEHPPTVPGTIRMVTPDTALPSTAAIDTNAPTRCAPGESKLPELRLSTVPTDLGMCGTHRVVRVLGRGGMGVIYEAIDTALDRRVALKLMRPELAASAEGRERFLREARSAAAIRHENVVSVYAVGEDGGNPYLAMELLRGEHLGQRAAAGLSVAEAVRIGREVACGLAAAHALGVVHRDVKPTNIWIEEPGGRVRLLDFGLARSDGPIDQPLPQLSPGGSDLTEVGALMGTPAYMSPEQIDGGRADARSDLFGLGAVLYLMVTRRTPFRGDSMADLLGAIDSRNYTPVRTLAPDAPPALAGLIDRLLSPDPDDRPQSAAAVADELLAIGTDLAITSGGEVAVPVPDGEFEFEDAPPRPRRHKTATLALVGTAAIVVGALLVAGIAGRSVKPPPAPGPRPVAAAKPAAPAVTTLFNGRDLTGWRPVLGTADEWPVRGGAVLSGQRKDGVDAILLSEATFADFELRLEYRWPKEGGHTVVLLRAAESDDPIGGALAVNIGDDLGFPAVHKRPIGGLYRTGLVQWVTSDPPTANMPIGQWNHLHVTARGRTIDVKHNGVAMPQAVLTDKWAADKVKAGFLRPSGSIGLVAHWGAIDFRNITVRPPGE